MRDSRTRVAASCPTLSSFAASASTAALWVVAAASSVHAAGIKEWDGDGASTSWTDSTNWVGGTAATSDHDIVQYGASFSGTQQPTITTGTIPTTSSQGLALWLSNGLNKNVAITVNGTALNLNPETIDGVATTSILLNDAGNRNLTISGTGNVGIKTNTSFRVNNAGTLTISANALALSTSSLIIGGTSPDGAVVISSGISGSASNTYNLAGTLALSGTSSRTNNTSISSRVTLDYSTNNTQKLGTGTLTLSGSDLVLKGGSFAETASSTSINGGLNTIRRDTGGASLHLNAISRSNGAVVNFGTAGIADTDTLNNAAGILGAWAVVNGSDWAINSANATDSSITAYTGYTALSATDLTTVTANSVLTGSDSSTLASASKSTFTLKINTSGANQTLTLGSGVFLNLGSATSQTIPGGILFVGANDYTITGGVIRGGGNAQNAQEVVFSNYGTGKLTIASTIQNRGSGTNANVSTFAGTGTFVLAGNNSGSGGYRGTTNIFGATVEVSSNANLGGNSGGTYGNLSINGGTLRATDNLSLEIIDGANTYKRGISVGNAGATLDVASGKTLTATGVISGANNGIVTKTGAGTLALVDGVSTYTGRTYVNQGILSVAGTGSINSTSGLYINGGTVSYNSSAALTAPVTFISGTLKGTGTVGTAVIADTGDILAPGNSVGAQSYSAGLTLAGGGTYQWELSDAAGAEGNSSGGWDILNVTGGLGITATTGSKFTIEILSLTPANASGLAANFNPAVSAQWRIVNADATIANFDPNKFLVIATGFQNLNNQPTRWSVRRGDQVTGGDDNELYVTYVVPEPASLSLLGVAGMLFLTRRRQQRA